MMLEKANWTGQSAASNGQQVIGSATDDSGMEAARMVEEVIGKARQSYDDVVMQAIEATEANPLAAIAIVAGVAFLVGTLFTGLVTRRR